MKINFRLATERDAKVLAALHTEVDDHLTAVHGQGPWSAKTTEKDILRVMRNSRLMVALLDSEVVGTMRLTTRKPRTIDVSFFTLCKAIYLDGMAVRTDKQRQGIGGLCLKQAVQIAKTWPTDAIRLDAYDTKAGAGEFYERFGFAKAGRGSYCGTPRIYYELLL